MLTPPRSRHDSSPSRARLDAGPALFAADKEELLSVEGGAGRPGGRLVVALRSEPKTFNPVTATDAASREVYGRTTADLVHINRETLREEPALARSVKV